MSKKKTVASRLKRDDIPKRFYHGEHQRPRARTIGELKELLAQLPDDLDTGDDERCISLELRVINLSKSAPGQPYLTIEEVDDE